MYVIREHILPLLDRVSWNRYCSTSKEVHDASRGVAPYCASRGVAPYWPYKRLQADSAALSLVFSPDGGLLACACYDGIILIWDRLNGRCTRLEGHTDCSWTLSFSPDAKMLASAGADRTIRCWRLADNICTMILEGHTGNVNSVVFAPNGLFLASGSDDGSIRIWDINDGSCTEIMEDERMDCVKSVVFSPDGATLASAGSLLIGEDDDEEDDGELQAGVAVILLWDFSDENTASTGTLLLQSQESNSRIMSMVYSPDGQYLASGGYDSFVRLFDVADRSLQTVFEGHVGYIWSVCFSPNGKILASASKDGCIRLWDVVVDDGSCLSNLSGHHNARFAAMMTTVAFSPDGWTLASGSYDVSGGDEATGTVCLWNPFEESKRDNNMDWEEVILLWNAKS
jgi:WD40 repeat protein